MNALTSSKDGTIYLYDTDMKTIIEAGKEDNAGKANTKQQVGWCEYGLKGITGKGLQISNIKIGGSI